MSDIRIPLLPQREGSFQTTGAMRHLHDAHTLEDRIGGGTDGSVCRGIARNGPEGEAHAIGAIPRRPHRAATPIGAIPPRRPQPAVILNPRPPSYPPTRHQRDMQAMEEHTRRAARAIASGGFMRASPYSVTRSLDEIIADHGECEVQPRAATFSFTTSSQANTEPRPHITSCEAFEGGSCLEVGSWLVVALRGVAHLVVEAQWHPGERLDPVHGSCVAPHFRSHFVVIVF